MTARRIAAGIRSGRSWSAAGICLLFAFGCVSAKHRGPPTTCGSPSAALGVGQRNGGALEGGVRRSACVAGVSAKLIHERIGAAAARLLNPPLFGSQPRFESTPLLPLGWPNPHGLVVFLYRTELSNSGAGGEVLLSPEWKVTISPVDAAPVIEHLGPAVRVGVQTGGDPVKIEEAEDALTQMAAGCRPASADCAGMAAYSAWCWPNHGLAKHLTETGVVFPCLRL